MILLGLYVRIGADSFLCAIMYFFICFEM